MAQWKKNYISWLNWVTLYSSKEASKIKKFQNKQVDYDSDRLSYLTRKTFLSQENFFGRQATNFFDTPQQVQLQDF